MQNEPGEKIIRHSKSGQKVTCQLALILCVTVGFIRPYTIIKEYRKNFTTIMVGKKWTKNDFFLQKNDKSHIFQLKFANPQGFSDFFLGGGIISSI